MANNFGAVGGTVDQTNYVINTHLRVHYDFRQMNRFTQNLTNIENHITRIGAGLNSRILGPLAGFAAVRGLSAMTRAMMSFNAEIEASQVGLAGVFTALTRTDMTRSLQASRAVVRMLRQDAREGVGELTQYMEGFQMIAGPGLAAGAKLSQIRELNKLSIAAGAMREPNNPALGMQRASVDILQGLEGRTGARTTPLVNQALQSIGVDRLKFNAMAQHERVETLLKAFRQFTPAIEAMGKTWNAQIETLRDNLKEIARTVNGEMFDLWRKQLIQVNAWLQHNEEAIARISKRIGHAGAEFWRNASGNPSGMLTTAQNVGTTGAMALGGIAAIRGGGAIANAPAAMGFAGGTAKDAGIALGFGASRAAAGATGVFALAVAGLITALMSGVKAFPKEGMKLATEITGLGLALTELATAFLKWQMSMPGLKAIGGLYIEVVRGIVWALTKLASFLTYFFNKLIALNDWLWSFVPSAAPLDLDGPDRGRALGRKRQNIDDLLGEAYAKTIVEVNGPVNIKITAERLDDPNVVASSLDTVFRHLANYPVLSGAGRLRPAGGR